MWMPMVRQPNFVWRQGLTVWKWHAVHEGYLLDQFTTKYTNRRTDQYGGTFDNRYRFAKEVVEEIKRQCGDTFPVSLRYSVTSKTITWYRGSLW